MTTARVMVVDDDAECAGELAELLESFGYAVVTAHSVPQARSVQSREDPDCALVDLRLGSQSGLELAMEWQGAARPRLLLLCGAEPSRAELAGFAGKVPSILLKPCPVEQLIAWIDQGIEPDCAIPLRPQ